MEEETKKRNQNFVVLHTLNNTNKKTKKKKKKKTHKREREFEKTSKTNERRERETGRCCSRKTAPNKKKRAEGVVSTRKEEDTSFQS